MRVPLSYPIGVPGQPWGAAEKLTWLGSRTRRRSYLHDVASKLQPSLPSKSLSDAFRVVQYGEVSSGFGASDASDSGGDGGGGGDCAGVTLPLLAAVPRRWDRTLPSVLVTGGVHGYETSGVRGALCFLLAEEGGALQYASSFNVVVIPCVSPWSYEAEERWNRDAVDPNRSFRRPYPPRGDESRAEESIAAMEFIDGLPPRRCGGRDDDDTDGEAEPAPSPVRWICHVDLHETTDSDRDEFRPARSARDGLPNYETSIPDGFYLVGDSEDPRDEFYRAILSAVERVTHIAPQDSDDDKEGGDGDRYKVGKRTICGHPSMMEGVVSVPCESLGVCGGGCLPDAEYATTTEVYPDSTGRRASWRRWQRFARRWTL